MTRQDKRILLEAIAGIITGALLMWLLWDAHITEETAIIFLMG